MAGNELANEMMVLREWASRQAAPGVRPSDAGGRWQPRPRGGSRPMLHRLGDALVAVGERLREWAGAPRQARA
jgi:hypothetical protein